VAAVRKETGKKIWGQQLRMELETRLANKIRWITKWLPPFNDYIGRGPGFLLPSPKQAAAPSPISYHNPVCPSSFARGYIQNIIMELIICPVLTSFEFRNLFRYSRSTIHTNCPGTCTKNIYIKKLEKCTIFCGWNY
jgi:hypothetical protein